MPLFTVTRAISFQIFFINKHFYKVAQALSLLQVARDGIARDVYKIGFFPGTNDWNIAFFIDTLPDIDEVLRYATIQGDGYNPADEIARALSPTNATHRLEWLLQKNKLTIRKDRTKPASWTFDALDIDGETNEQRSRLVSQLYMIRRITPLTSGACSILRLESLSNLRQKDQHF